MAGSGEGGYVASIFLLLLSSQALSERTLNDRCKLNTDIPLFTKIIGFNEGVLWLDSGLDRYVSDAESLGQPQTYRHGITVIAVGLPVDAYCRKPKDPLSTSV